MSEPLGAPISEDWTAENRPRLVRVLRDSPLPVSLAQESMLSYCQTSEDSARYVQAKIYQIVGPLDITVLRDCLSYIVGRHEILRTTFNVMNGHPVQMVHPAEPILLSIFDAAPGGHPKKDAARIIREETSLISDLTQGPLIRFSLLRIDKDKHWFFRICHHLLWDAWSSRLFLKELALLYEALVEKRPPPLPELESLQYADYASWQRKIFRHNGSAYQETVAWWIEHFQRDPAGVEPPWQRRILLRLNSVCREALAWWKAHFERHPPRLPWQRRILRRDGSVYRKARALWKAHFEPDPSWLELPFTRQAPLQGLDPTDGTIDWPVDLKLEERLNWLSRVNGTSLFVVWLAALVALLSAETGQPDIIIGTNMTSRRRHSDLRNMIGCFVNLVALRFQCDPATPFSNWLFEVRSSLTAAQDRCEIPHNELKNVLRGLGVAPPELQVIFLAPMGTDRVDMQFAGLELCELDLYTRSRMPWGLTIDLRKRHLQICRAYFDAGIYDPMGVRQFVGRLCELLDAFARHPEVPIGDLVAWRAASGVG